MAYNFYFDYYRLIYFLIAVFTGFFFVGLIITVVSIVGLWHVFQKAKEPGWAAIIPFYNQYVLFKITWGEGIMFLLQLVPLVGLVFTIITNLKLAQAFGKSIWFALGLIFLNPIFLCILGFDSRSKYLGVPGREGEYTDPGAYHNTYSQPRQTTYRRSEQCDRYFYQQPSQEDTQQTATGFAKYCSSCAAPLLEGARFCSQCAKSV